MALAALAGLAGLIALADRLATRFYLAEAHDRAASTLRLTVSALDGHLARFQVLPALLADDARLRATLSPPADPDRIAATNRWLEETTGTAQSSDIYVMRADGLTVAASNHARPDSFVGQNFAFRPYFTQAMAGGRGEFYALGTTSGVRGYYYSAPVRGTDGRIAGVVAVKVGLDDIEAGWRDRGYHILVTDPQGVVFLSSEPAWLYSGLLPLTPDRLAASRAVRRYADRPLGELAVDRRQEQGEALIALTGAEGAQEYLELTQTMPQAGWTVHVLQDTAYLRGQARLAVAAFVLLLGVALSVGLILWQRRARLAERIALQTAAQAELEARVAARTADLARVNAQLEREIAGHRATESALRRTQRDLVQAGKLAALGQMSAALSHEINQPLAAARNYADSAMILIDRGDTARARENVGQILSLIDRMATIARHLRHVARKPDQPLQDLSLPAVLDEALTIVRPRLDQAQARLTIDLPAGLPAVRGGAVRLSQVLVNVLTNAADAVQDLPRRDISVTARIEGDHVVLSVADTGPGVPAAIAERIFDPFFTTKRVGAGLGLGLSISYNILKDFGGDLRLATAPGGGAEFQLWLRPSAPAAMAAQ
ncbi:MAG: sensor histidine kinase [Rhodobacterales bacterium]|nr:sensor histidine kinase [Rhodobacterales bacterium]